MPQKSANMASSENTLSKQKRRRWLIIFLLILVGVMMLIWLATLPLSQSGKITIDALSERAREFLAAEQQKGSSIWENKTLDSANKTPSSSTTTVKTACFQADLSFPIRSTEKIDSETCLVTLRVASPPSRLTIMLAGLDSDLDDHSGVLMRNATPQTYSPVNNFSSPYADFRIFTDPQGVSYFAQIDNQLLSIVFSETSDQKKILNQTLPEVLNTLQILPPVTPTIEGNQVTPTLVLEPPTTLQ